MPIEILKPPRNAQVAEFLRPYVQLGVQVSAQVEAETLRELASNSPRLSASEATTIVIRNAHAACLPHEAKMIGGYAKRAFRMAVFLRIRPFLESIEEGFYPEPQR